MSRDEFNIKKQMKEPTPDVYGDPDGRDCEDCINFMDCNPNTGCIGFKEGRDD